MTNQRANWKMLIRDRKFLLSLGAALLLLILGAAANFSAGVYATEHASNPVTDIVLSNIPVFDVDGIFVYGPFLFWMVIVGYLIFFAPKKMPFTFKSIGIFLFVRAIFVSLTHIGPFPTQVVFDPSNFFNVLSSGNDLFFSGHTGLPFLMALVFWENRALRLFSIASSVILGIVVLLGHLHYSIDVLGAFFITYTIFHIAERLFKRDRLLFLSET